jgi:hypothetical protein
MTDEKILGEKLGKSRENKNQPAVNRLVRAEPVGLGLFVD